MEALETADMEHGLWTIISIHMCNPPVCLSYELCLCGPTVKMQIKMSEENPLGLYISVTQAIFQIKTSLAVWLVN